MSNAIRQLIIASPSHRLSQAICAEVHRAIDGVESAFEEGLAESESDDQIKRREFVISSLRANLYDHITKLVADSFAATDKHVDDLTRMLIDRPMYGLPPLVAMKPEEKR